jgi:hypothetical protein
MFSIRSSRTMSEERPRTPPPSRDSKRNGALGFLSGSDDSIFDLTSASKLCWYNKVITVVQYWRLAESGNDGSVYSRKLWVKLRCVRMIVNDRIYMAFESSRVRVIVAT